MGKKLKDGFCRLRILVPPFGKGRLGGIRKIIQNMSHYLKHTARKLRNNCTEAEFKLWQHLKRKQIDNLQFYRQRPLGKYIVDFYCPKEKLVIEVDGGQHYIEGDIIEYDKVREDFLRNILKLKIIRFTNIDVMKNMSAVIDKIIESI
ncbi:MAG: protein of unknown function DUF559 [uncultured bacterium]|nr:MAG: protein of unknown function DUF559 [uncultured bacterium]